MSRAFDLTARIQRRIVPELRYSQEQFEERLREYAAGAAAWLDLGCGHHMLPVWREKEERELLASCPFVVGLDYDFDSLRKHRSIRLRLRGDASHLPFADESFDLVTANMVVEHLGNPEEQFTEVARVLRPGGIFLFHTPNDQSYIIRVSKLFPDWAKKVAARVLEGRVASDVFPTHYRANRPETVQQVAARSGFTVARMERILTTPMFGAVPPLAALELLFIRQLRRPGLASLRPNLVVALRKEPAPQAAWAGRAGEERPAISR